MPRFIPIPVLAVQRMNLSHFSSQDDDHQVLEFLAALSYRTGDLSSYLHEIVCGVSRLLQSDWSIVTLCQGESGQVIASSLDSDGNDNGFSMHGTLAGEIIYTGHSLVIGDTQQEPRRCNPPKEYRSYLGVPLRTTQGEISGTICSFFYEPRQFSASAVRVVELFAERAATAIDNYRLYQQQQRFNALLEQEVANRTEELRIAQARLVERERLAAIGEFAATIVHEVRNPLTTIMMGLKYAEAQFIEPTARDRLSLSLEEADRLQQLLNEILVYAKPQVLKLAKINLSAFLYEILNQIRELPEAYRRHIELKHHSSEIEIMGDVNKLKQVFINLFRNACEAIEPGEKITCKLITNSDSKQAMAQIHNGGEPIPSDILPRLMEPFCSTKHSGTGLGLAIVKRIVTAHEGKLFIQSSAESGTTVTVQLPLVSSE